LIGFQFSEFQEFDMCRGEARLKYPGIEPPGANFEQLFDNCDYHCDCRVDVTANQTSENDANKGFNNIVPKDVVGKPLIDGSGHVG
jgi:hypothetical protein